MLHIQTPDLPETGAIADATTALQGQWFRQTNDASGDPIWEVVDSYADAQKNIRILAPILKPPFEKDSGDDTYETIYSNDGESTDNGKPPSFLVTPNALIEDTKLADRVLGDFDSATAGDLMVLTVSGYPTLDGASDDPGSSATPVGAFIDVTNDIVRYRRF